MRTWTQCAALAAIIALGAGAIYMGKPAQAQDEKGREASDELVHARKLSAANDDFGFDVFKQLHKEGQNTFISPTSIGMCLQMTSRGAAGDTQSEMEEVMGVKGFENIGASNSALMGELSRSESVTLNIANSVWYHQSGIVLDDEFVNEVKKQFDAEIAGRDFADPTTLSEINGWVSKKTQGKIPNLLSDLSPEAVTVLVNAIYFKGDWTIKFDKEKTKEADWHSADGTSKKIQLMSNKDEYRYHETDDAQVIGLAYGKLEKKRMWVVLPKEGNTLDDLVTDLDEQKFSNWKKSAWKREGTIELPRFKMKFKKNIKPDLQALGMKKCFEGDADFSAMEEGEGGQLFIGKVIHEAIIEVNEEGTVAAAATAVEMQRGMPPKPFTVRCDRPFLLVIEDSITGSNLFVGTVYDPQNLD